MRLIATRERLKAGRPGDGDQGFTGEIAHRTEQRLLKYFWAEIRLDIDRLGLLLEFTKVVVQRPQDWSTQSIRAAHQTNYGASPNIKLSRSRCFACEAAGQLYAHHVIEIQNGGSNTLRNQVPLCFDCHQYLHPWLTEDDRVKPAPEGFESVGDIAARALRGER